MLDFNFIKEVHFSIGPISVNFGNEKERENFGVVLILLSLIMLVLPGLPIGVGFPKLLKDLLVSLGIISLLVGGFLMQTVLAERKKH